MTDGRPRLAFLHYSCPPVIGGAETVMAVQARLHARAWVRRHPVVAGRGQGFAPGVPVAIEPLLSATHRRVRTA